MAHLIAAILRNRPASDAALIDERGETSWALFDRRTNQLIHALRGAGLSAGDRVAVLAGNRREYFELFAACAHAALLTVPINSHSTADEVRYILADSGARALFVDDRFAELGAVATWDANALALTATIGHEVSLPGFASYEQLLAGAPPGEPEDQGQGGVMFYTSGTTGRPKGVRRLGALGGPMQAAEVMSRGFSMMMGTPLPGVTLLNGPVYHSAQWAFSYLPLMAGSTVVMRHKFDAAEMLELIDRHRVTNVHVVPTQLTRLLRLDEATRRSFDGSSLRIVWHGAAPCPPEVKRRMIEWWGPIVTEYYGGTEGAIVTLISATEWLERPSSVGRPVPTVELSVVGEDGEPCAAGEPGQVYVRSLLAADFEYHGDRDKTTAAHRGPGIFSMGDVGYLDAGGYLHLVDRKIDLIISGGVNIYPAEIERVLRDDPRVAEAAVFGIPDDEFGERVMAVVEPAPGVEVDDALRDQLLDRCRAQLATFKVPRAVEFAALPRTETGKLEKRRLRDPYWAVTGRRI